MRASRWGTYWLRMIKMLMPQGSHVAVAAASGAGSGSGRTALLRPPAEAEDWTWGWWLQITLGGRFGNRFEVPWALLVDARRRRRRRWRSSEDDLCVQELHRNRKPLLRFSFGNAVFFISFLGVLSDRKLMLCGGREGVVSLRHVVFLFFERERWTGVAVWSLGFWRLWRFWSDASWGFLSVFFFKSIRIELSGNSVSSFFACSVSESMSRRFGIAWLWKNESGIFFEIVQFRFAEVLEGDRREEAVSNVGWSGDTLTDAV